MFGTLLSKLAGFFSASFWVGNYLPVLVAAALNGLVDVWVYPTSNLFGLLENEKAAHAAGAAFVILVIAYMISPLTPLVTQVLDGSFLPKPMRTHMLRRYTAMAEEARREINALGVTAKTFERVAGQGTLARLRDARKTGSSFGAVSEPTAIDTACESVVRLETLRSDGELPEPGALSAAIDLLQTALVRNTTNPSAGDPLAGATALLDSLHWRLTQDLLPYCAAESRARLNRAYTRWRGLVAIDGPQPTLFGNMRSVAEAYPRHVYNVDFEYIWPRLQLLLTSDSGQLTALTLARAQVDFTALLLMLLLPSCVVWMGLLVWHRVGGTAFAVLAVAGPVLACIVYRLTVLAEMEFGSVIKASIDRNRFDVLKMLKQPKPSTLYAERELWARIQRAEEAPQVSDLTYRYE